jgi:hypothetical protein
MIALARRLSAVLILMLVGVALSTVAFPRTRQAVHAAQGSSITWAGHRWTVTTGAMAAHNTGSARNVFVDPSGSLHLRITKVAGQWRCAELFTTDRLGFGTYQWQVEGRIDQLDAHVVLGLYLYGPAAGIGADGTNEIDVEYSRWGHPAGPNGDWAVYPASGSTVGRSAFAFALHGSATTSRFMWTGAAIGFSLMGGFQPVGTTVKPIRSWTYAPAHPGVNLPQRTLPLGMNLWLFDGKAPVDGRSVSVVIHGFTMVPRTS